MKLLKLEHCDLDSSCILITEAYSFFRPSTLLEWLMGIEKYRAIEKPIIFVS